MPDIAAVQVRTEEHEQALRLFEQGKYEDAAKILSVTLNTRETSEIWNDWATAQLMLGKAADSEEGYRRALELDPQSTRAAGNLGALLATCGRVREAIPLLERAANKSAGVEHEQLLRLIQTFRTQTPSNGENSLEEPILLQMARVIRQQSQAIAALTNRVAALESGPAWPQASPLPSSPAIRQAATDAAPQPIVSNAIRELSQRGGTAAEVAPAVEGRQGECSSENEGPQPGVYFGSVVYGGSGYSEEGWPVALGLAEHGVPVQLVPIDQESDSHKLVPEGSRRALKALERQLVDVPRSVLFQSSPAPWWNLDQAGRVRIGRTMFETDRLPEAYGYACNSMDEVWVPSHFNLEIFTKGGVDKDKLRFVPGGVDTHVFHPNAQPLDIKPKRSFNFLSIFDWHLRKGYDVLLRAYLHEFSADDDVALILKVYQIAGSSNIEAQIAHFTERLAGLPIERAPAIILLNGFIPQPEMARLYATADAFVLPSRGEAYGRPYLEAMACRLPVIATNWGGQLDFLNRENSYLIDSSVAPVPPDVEIDYYRGHCWAEPSLDHLRQLMREVYSRHDEARLKAEQGRQDVLANYDWSVVVPRWVGEFRRLLN
jgi:glycosyltransferase involved in cell wall biosynthesis